jgi:hypothetical protein
LHITHLFSPHRLGLLVALMAAASADATAFPQAEANVAQIALPETALARKAATFAASNEPGFLLNHSIRTYVFGAMMMNAKHLRFDPETAYVAALLHDLGLEEQFATPGRSFEVDGANRAEVFVRENNGTDLQARTVWNAIAMHDMGGSFQSHASPEAMLVGYGAASDVDGPPSLIPKPSVDAVLVRYPRAGFKVRFTELATEHCKRKPTSQSGWLDILCREVMPHTDRGSVRDEIASAPFAE